MVTENGCTTNTPSVITPVLWIWRQIGIPPKVIRYALPPNQKDKTTKKASRSKIPNTKKSFTNIMFSSWKINSQLNKRQKMSNVTPLSPLSAGNCILWAL